MHTDSPIDQPITRELIVTTARAWLGTRYRHQGRLRGHAVDCGGRVLGVAHALDLTTLDFTGYGPLPRDVEQTCDAHMARTDKPQPGDVLLFRVELNDAPKHLAIMTPIGIIHAWAASRKVCEHRIDALWQSRLVRGYVLPGVA